MVMSSTDPFEQANEADVAEQAQDVEGAAPTEPEYSPTEADEADILEQGAEISEPAESDEAYPRAGSEDDPSAPDA